ncbi:hypothetical protein [Geodermatophilus maliterrae]|uniref:Uncharacterized protein n=1 Tax=Geodermatophilus maliterrae TaxID=3162531 RepID=A0ABV3XDA7_9ACTN
MSVPVDRPPRAAEDSGPAVEVPDSPAALVPTETKPAKRGLEERGWLLFAVVVAFILLAFTGMIVLTALGGGTTYVR